MPDEPLPSREQRQHSRLRELFVLACDLSLTEQAAFVNEHCADAPELRQQLEVLLRGDSTDGLLKDGDTLAGFDFQLETQPSKLPAAIGQYKVERILGEGGMGIVYLAQQQNPHRDVAVKVIRSGMINQELVRRFELEASVLGRLQHPGIASIYEAGIFVDAESGLELPFLAMEFVRGVPLRQYAEQSNCTTKEILQLVVRICNAVNHAHQRGVIHRDLKPSNVLVKNDGQPSVLDFGVARVEIEEAETHAEHTRAGQLIGTLPYMSPEQVAGNSVALDTRSDVYALGLITYELLANDLPYDVRNTEHVKAAAAILEQQPSSLANIRREYRGDLDTIVLKTLSKEPDRRYQTAKDFADDIERYLNSQPIEARRTGGLERFWRWCCRNQAIAVLGASVAGLVLSVAGIASYAAVELRTAADRLQAESEISNRRLYDSYLDQVRLRQLSHRPGQRDEAIAALEKASKIFVTLPMDSQERAAHLLRLRSDTISSLATIDLSEIKTWPRPPGVDKIRFDADYERYAVSDLEGNIRIYRVKDNALLHEFISPGGSAWTLRFSKDGNYFASVFHTKPERCVRVWDTNSGKLLLQQDGTFACYYAFSDRANLFANCDADWNIQIVALDDLDRPPVVLHTDFEPKKLYFRNENQIAAWSHKESYRTQIELFQLADKVSRRVEIGGAPYSIAFDSVREKLAIACADGSIRVFDSDNLDEPFSRLTGHMAQVVALDFSSTGEFLVSYAWDGTQRFWDVLRNEEILVNAERDRQGERFFGGRKNRLGFLGKDQFGIREFGFDEAVNYLQRRTWEIAFHPGTPLVAIATNDGVEIWNTKSREIAIKLECGKPRGLLFSADGSMLYSSGIDGVLAWPVELDTSNLASLRIESPTTLLTAEDIDLAELEKRTGLNLLDSTGMHEITLDDSGRWLSVDCGEVIAAVIDLQKSKEFRLLFGNLDSFQDHIDGAAISPDGKWVVVGNWQGNGVWVWDAQTGELATKLTEENGTAVAQFSPDGKKIAVSTTDTLSIFDAVSWKLTKQFPREVNDWAGAIAFSPDSQYLVSAYDRRTLQLLRLETGECLARFQAHKQENIYLVRFSPDGNTLAATTSDFPIFWDLSAIRARLRSMGIDWKN